MPYLTDHRHIGRLIRAVKFASQYRVNEILTIVLATYSVGLGTSFMLTHFPEGGVLDQMAGVISLKGWGAALVVVSFLLALTMTINRRKSIWPAFLLFMIYAMFTVSTALLIPSSAFVPVVGWMFLFTTFIAAMVVASAVFGPAESDHRLKENHQITWDVSPPD